MALCQDPAGFLAGVGLWQGDTLKREARWAAVVGLD